jgi:hypothetical protein
MEGGGMTEAELLDALREALAPTANDPDGAFTSEELLSLTGYGEKKIRNALKAMLRKGECECVRVKRQNIVGVTVPVPAWRFRK